MAIGAVVLPGCAVPTSLPETPGLPGQISGQPGRRGVVIAAPHATSDARTGDIVAELGRRTGFGVIIASGFGEGAHHVFEAYGQRVRQVAQGPLAFYAEIHGSNHRDMVNSIEIATVGIDHDEAVRLRALLELIRDAHLRANREAPRLEIRVEPADDLRDAAASGAKRDDILRIAQRALHIELPRVARTEWREAYTAILADFLAQAAPLSPAR